MILILFVSVLFAGGPLDTAQKVRDTFDALNNYLDDKSLCDAGRCPDGWVQPSVSEYKADGCPESLIPPATASERTKFREMDSALSDTHYVVWINDYAELPPVPAYMADGAPRTFIESKAPKTM